MALIEIVATTTMEEVLRAYPAAKVGLFQSYHIGGCESCGYQPTQTLEEVRRDFKNQDGLDKASYFRAYGFPRARSLSGGLAAWAAEVGHAAFPVAAKG